MLALTAFVLAAAATGTTSLWARFPVERTAFSVVGKRFSATGKFAGVGLMRINGEALEFSGLRADPPLSLASPSPAYEFYFESFTITSLIRSERTGTGESGTVDELAFEAIRNGIYRRKLTGKIRLRVDAPSPLRGPTGKVGEYFGKVVDFRADEHGNTYDGVMTRLSLASSADAKAMMRKYEDIFFGDYVATESEE